MISLCGIRRLFLGILFVCSSLQAQYSSGLLLKKTHNVTINVNRAGTFPCEIQKGYILTSVIDVQWIIDDFGYTKDGMETAFGSKFNFIYDIKKGIFNLILNNATLRDDESTFMCQINYRVKDEIKTLSGDLMYLKVIIRPKQVSMVQKMRFSSYEETKVIKEIQGELLNSTSDSSETQVADAPHSPDAPGYPSNIPETGTVNVYEPEPVAPFDKIKNRLWLIENQTVQIECHSTPSKPKVNLIWFLNGLSLHDKSKLNLEDDQFSYNIAEKFSEEKNENDTILIKSVTTLELIASRSIHKKQLECRVNDSSTANTGSFPIVSAIIEVSYVEKVNMTILNNDIVEGDKVTVDCQSIAHPDDVVYFWTLLDNDSESHAKTKVQNTHLKYLKSRDLKRDYMLPHMADDEVLLSKYITRNSSILLNFTRDHDKKRLRCWAGSFIDYDEFWRIQPSWNYDDRLLRVKYSPKIEGPIDQAYSGNFGDTISLSCTSISNPQGDVRWFKILPEERDLFEKLSLKNMKNPEITVLSNMESFKRKALIVGGYSVVYNLKIRSKDDHGMYACQAINSIYPPAIKRVVVDQPGPIKIQPAEKIFGRIGKAGKLSCYIHGIPKPTPYQISWYRNGLPVVEDKTHRFYYESFPSGVESILYFNELNRNDITSYNCSANNGYGEDWKIIELFTTDEIPMAFAIGSGAALLLAILFSGIIFCIIRHSKQQIIARNQFNSIHSSKLKLPDQYIELTSTFSQQHQQHQQQVDCLSPYNLLHPQNDYSQSMKSTNSLNHFSPNHLLKSKNSVLGSYLNASSHSYCGPEPQQNSFSLHMPSSTPISQFCNSYDMDAQQCKYLQDVSTLMNSDVTNDSSRSYDSGTVSDVYNKYSSVKPVYLTNSDIANSPNSTLPIFFTSTQNILKFQNPEDSYNI